MRTNHDCPPTFRPLASLTNWLTLAWGVAGVASLGTLFLAWRLDRLLVGIAEGRPLAEDAFARFLLPPEFLRLGGSGFEVLLPAFFHLFWIAEIAGAALAVPAGIISYAFLFRARSNVDALGCEARYAPHWIITGWLIPLLNLVRPYQVVADLYRACAPGGGRAPSTSALVRRWWGLVLLGSGVGLWSGRVIALSAVDWSGVIAIAAVLRIALVAVVIAMLRSLAESQHARAAGGEPRAASLAWLPSHAGVDLVALALVALALWFGAWRGGRNAGAAFAEYGEERERAAAALAAARAPVTAWEERMAEREAIAAAAANSPETDAGVPGGVEGGVLPGVPIGPPAGAKGVAAPGNSAVPLRWSSSLSRVAGRPALYTEAARRARVQGIVIVEAVVDERGDVTGVTVLKGLSHGLDEAAVSAVRSWKFKPATVDGRPLAVYQTLSVSFRLE